MRIEALRIKAGAAVFSARSLTQFALLAVVLAPAFLSLPACQAIEPYLVAAPVVELPPDDSKWRPFGQYAKLPDPGGPTQPQQSTIVPGTGVFVGSTKPMRADRRGGGDPRGYTLNLVNATVPEAAKAVLGDIFGVNYIVDPKIDARVTVQTSQPLNRTGIGELFETSLRTNGIAVVQTGNVYRVVTADQAAMGAQLNSGGALAGAPVIGNSTKVIQLQFISPIEMKRILDPLASFGGVVRVDDARNALVISGTEQEIGSMEEAVSVFDVDVMRGMSFALVPVSAVEPDAIVDDLTKIFSSNREGPMAGMVQFIANKRLKSILVISKQPKYLKQAEQWVRRLDARAVGTQRQLYTYVLRNRQAKEVVEILQSIFAAETATGGQAGRGDVAPRFRRASAESSTTQGQQTPQFSTSASPAGSQTLVQQSFSAFGVNPRQPPAAATGAPTEQEGDTVGAGIVPDTDGEPRIKIVADVPNNALVIRATQVDYKRVERVIANLDIVPNQVLIEATICEVNLTDDLKFGVRWFVRSQGGTQAATFSSALDGAINSVFPGFSWIYKAGSTQVTLNALNSLTRVNVLASPALMVLDGRTAALQIGDQVPITTQTATSVITPGAPVVNSVSYRDTGVILSVTPRINEAGRVLLEIEQEVSSVAQTTTSKIDSPTFARRRVKTTVLVNDGEAVTLGGLIQNQKTYTADQVPVLGNIPIIGNAFKDKDDKVQKTELIILLTPKVVRDMTEAQQVTSEYRRKIGEFAPRRRDPVKQFKHDVKRTLQ